MQYPYWPPGPSEQEEWRRTLEERPDLSPAVEKIKPTVCGMADGASDWMVECQEDRHERLQCLGNGVVSLTGAVAFKVLWERMVNDNKEDS